MNNPFDTLIPLRLEDVDAIWITLRDRGFEFAECSYAHFTARRNGLHVTAYERGPRLLVQGNGSREFVEDIIEPLVAARAGGGMEALSEG